MNYMNIPLAEREGLEPPQLLHPSVFKTAAARPTRLIFPFCGDNSR